MSSDITLRALVKLLENMKTVTEKAEDQQTLLQNLTKLVGQLREENKVNQKVTANHRFLSLYAFMQKCYIYYFR